MSRWMLLSALGAAFLAVPAFGQRGGHAGFAGHGGMAPHASMGAVHGGARGGFAARPVTSARWGVGFHGPPFPGRCFGCFHHHHHFPRYYGWYGYPWWGWYGDSGWYEDSSYSEPNYPAYDYNQNYPAQNYETERLRGEVDRLSAEVERLRQEREQTVQKSQSKTKAETAQLIFRDKHMQEVENYAIVDHTLWLLDNKTAKKIALSELDIPATIKANEERGVDFAIPQ